MNVQTKGRNCILNETKWQCNIALKLLKYFIPGYVVSSVKF